MRPDSGCNPHVVARHVGYAHRLAARRNLADQSFADGKAARTVYCRAAEHCHAIQALAIAHKHRTDLCVDIRCQQLEHACAHLLHRSFAAHALSHQGLCVAQPSLMPQLEARGDEPAQLQRDHP
jgi:hypothetical protein